MFRNCTSLEEFTAALPSNLDTTTQMFDGCSSLTSFTPSLPSALKTATNMFRGCKLDKESVQNIVNTIPTYTSGTHQIAIGVDSTKITQAEQNAFNTTLTGKRWTVTWERN